MAGRLARLISKLSILERDFPQEITFLYAAGF
jgi:hypothetical protein